MFTKSTEERRETLVDNSLHIAQLQSSSDHEILSSIFLSLLVLSNLDDFEELDKIFAFWSELDKAAPSRTTFCFKI